MQLQLLVAEGEAEVGLDLFAGGAAGRAAEDEIVGRRIFLGRREQELDFVIVSGVDRIKCRSVTVAVAEVGVLVGVEQDEIDIGGVVGERCASRARNEGLKCAV